MLDTEAHSLEEITDLMLDNMLSSSVTNFEISDKVRIKKILRDEIFIKSFIVKNEKLNVPIIITISIIITNPYFKQ